MHLKTLIQYSMFLFITLTVMSFSTETSCTQEAMMCPDGTSVVREAETCTFPQCPALEDCLSAEVCPQDGFTPYNKGSTCKCFLTPEAACMAYCETPNCTINQNSISCT